VLISITYVYSTRSLRLAMYIVLSG
jgi:hypothetical protein